MAQQTKERRLPRGSAALVAALSVLVLCCSRTHTPESPSAQHNAHEGIAQAPSAPGEMRAEPAVATAHSNACARIEACCAAYARAQFSETEPATEAQIVELADHACEHAPSHNAIEDMCERFLEGLQHSLLAHRLAVPYACTSGESASPADTATTPIRPIERQIGWEHLIRGQLPNALCANVSNAPDCGVACFPPTPDLLLTTTSAARARVMVHSEGDAVVRVVGPTGSYCSDDQEGLDPVVELSAPAGEYRIYVGVHVETVEERRDSIDPQREMGRFVLRTTLDAEASTETLREALEK